MDAGRSDPLALAEERLRWLDQRQRVLAQNIANANTPGYQPQDLVPFAQHLARTDTAAEPRRTDAAHLPGQGGDGVRKDRTAIERAPDGNAVSLDQQALKVAETDQAHALATALRSRWLAMYRTALGRNG
ncbi:flagellar basal body rod protein FlgB [Roseicella aquatilis]|uniref:Flagellar biosynthesis protein FlgB n=1 Tax=Roseicella aquatilis TaxID=2527868 RepID=A0A4R4D3P6_9PROT|nr:flagellar basal body protein [Roseicella aquatilis]TCZ53674.1 flagellar biosynthesis protein FlgB [Roseicella aquatilis]